MTNIWSRSNQLKFVSFLGIIILLKLVYWQYSESIIQPPSDLETYPNPSASKEHYPFTIVTGASANHFCSLQSWLYYTDYVLSFLSFSKRPRIIVYDLGLFNYQRKILRLLKKKSYFYDARVFNFSSYPSFWNISKARGEYAWKPAIVAQVAREYPGIVVWLDSGAFISADLISNVKKLLKLHNGFLSPRSSGNILEWTHPGVFKYYNEDPQTLKKFSYVHNCNGAAIFLDTHRVQHIIDEWEKCAYVKECIAPEGSSRSNHRQDQAILTYLVAKDNRRCNLNSKPIGIKTRRDKFCAKEIWNYERVYGEIWNLKNTTERKEVINEIKELKERWNNIIVYDVWSRGAKMKLLESFHEGEDVETYDENIGMPL